MSNSLLAVLAHPDDESCCSGTLALLAEKGWHVVLACATRGEAGEISDPSLASAETLGEVRESELRAAAAVLGITDVRLLGYCDSGMAGTALNDVPTSFRRADPGAVIGQLTSLIAEIRPEIVLTFEPFGVYGHPDHVAISEYTTRAFDLFAENGPSRRGAPPWQPARLLYAAFPESWFAAVLARLSELGLEREGIEALGAEIKENAEQIERRLTHRIDVSNHVSTKVRSLACHRTQLSPQGPFYHLLRPELADVLSTEYFLQARPKSEKLSAELAGLEALLV